MKKVFTPERLDKYLFFGSTLCCSLVVVPVINFWFIFFDPIEAGEVIFNEAVWLRSWIIPVSVACYISTYLLFSHRKAGFVLVSVIGFLFSMLAMLTVAQLFSRFNKPLEYSKFWPFFGFSLAIGIVVSLGMMSFLTFVRGRVVRFVSEHRRLP